MRYKGGIRHTTAPIDLGEAMALFGILKREHPECLLEARLGMRLIRLVQHLHNVIKDVRKALPQTYDGYADPARLDAALSRTKLERAS